MLDLKVSFQKTNMGQKSFSYIGASVPKKLPSSMKRNISLKVVSTTFSLICFLSLNDSTSQTKKNAFYFTSKALFSISDFQIS